MCARKKANKAEKQRRHAHFVRDPTLEHMPYNRTAWIVGITETNRSFLVVHLVDKGAIAGTGADGGKVDGGRIRNCLALAVSRRVYVTDCLVHDSHIHNHGIMKPK